MGKILTESEKVEQQNKLIAEFMGWDVIRVGYYGQAWGEEDDETEWQNENREWLDKMGIESIGRYMVKVKENDWFLFDDAKYHSSWDWLIPAWYKFRDLTFKDRKNEIPHSHHCQSISRAICYEDIGSAYSRLSAAIEWHLAYTQPSPQILRPQHTVQPAGIKLFG